MSIVISGTDGITPLKATNGSAGAPSVTGTDTDTGLFFGTNEVNIATGGTERVKVDSSGRVGIGTTTPDRVFHVSGSVSFPARLESTGPNVLLDFKTSGNTALSTTAGAISDAFVVNTNSTERMRISANGATTINPNNAGLFLLSMNSGAGTSTLKYSHTSTGQVTFDTSSRLVKEDIKDCPYGIAEVQALKPRKYFRTDDQKEEIGFIADELLPVLPEFVPMGPKSAITAEPLDTEIIPLGVNYEKLTAVLTKALQEAIAKIETLEAKVAALEGGAS